MMARTASAMFTRISKKKAPMAIMRKAALIGIMMVSCWISCRSVLPRDMSWPVAVLS